MSLAVSSKRTSLKSLVSAFAVLGLGIAVGQQPAYAATASLQKIAISNFISLGVKTTMTSYSFWSSNQYNCTGGGSSRTRNIGCGFYYGPGTFETYYPVENNSTRASEWADFNNLPSGLYTLYAIASGMTLSVFPFQSWYASTGDSYYTVP